MGIFSSNTPFSHFSNGKYAEALKKYEAIAAGFVDGDLEILYQR